MARTEQRLLSHCSPCRPLRALLTLLLVDWLAVDVSARFAVNPLTRHLLEQRMRSISSNIVWDKYNFLNAVAGVLFALHPRLTVLMLRFSNTKYSYRTGHVYSHAAVCEELLESENQVGELERDSLLRHLSAEQLDAWSHLYELSAFWDVSVLPPQAELVAGNVSYETVAQELMRIVNSWGARQLLNTGLPGTNTRDAEDLLNRLKQAKAFGCSFDTCFVKQDAQTDAPATRGVGAVVDSKTGAFESLDRMQSSGRPYAVVLVCALG